MGLDSNSIGSLLSLLDEPENELKVFALQSLLAVVDANWAVISESLPKLEDLAETEGFSHRELASALASRCFYHLEEYEEATRLALASGEFLQVDGSSSYSKAIVNRCLETYVSLRGVGLNPKMQAVVDQMFAQCYTSGNFKRAIGLAMDARRLDTVREAIKLSSPNETEMLAYALNHTPDHATRPQVLELLVQLFPESGSDRIEYLDWFICLHSLGRVDEYAALLLRLLESEDKFLVAYQAAFDLVEFQDQHFEKALGLALTAAANGKETPTPEQDKRLETLRAILFGGKKAALLLDFMYKRNGTDSLLLKRFKEASDAGRKNSILHHAMVVAHGYAQCGTTADAFLRDNLEWLSRASNWAKFGATASLGVVHKGNVESAMQLLRPYLPDPNQGNNNASPYSEGGALYALGLIHSAEGVSPTAKLAALDHLTTCLDNSAAAENPIARDSLMHGSCLGIGLVSMSSGDDAMIERLRNVLYSDSAVVGEAAALGMGLVMLGGGKKHATFLQDLIGYAHDTQHEKIVRAVSLCAAFTYYGQEEEADSLIEQLTRDKDHLIRYGGVFTIASAYVGTANNAAVRSLLHIAVSDVSNDVRRAAVMCLGLVMIKLPERLPGLIGLLSESYNPHVRYGACMALGIGCSAQADPKEALDLLEPLLDDKTDFVRQGAMMATAILLAPIKPESDARSKRFRDKLATVVSDSKLGSTMTRMGALLASGIVDSGGRNAFVSLLGRNGKAKAPAVAGVILWLQYWYWYPLMHMLSLSLSPSVLIGVNAELDMPKQFQVDLEGGEVFKRFGMPDMVEEKKEEVKTRIKSAILSKSQSRRKQAAAVSPAPSLTAAAAAATAAMEEDKPKKPVVVEDAELLTNPIRVTKNMAEYVRFKSTGASRYVPVCGESHSQSVGVVVLRDTRPDEVQDILKVAVPPTGDVDPDEPAAPEPFYWTAPSI
ncbi:hypothetical protein BASA81_002357 [Batrachochytrium salamandrivorans]|nr:hypothetical protein BASA81_002357 [Batrachochytrium salamandrivorans]